MNAQGIKHVHCVGIGGIGLSAVASVFLSRGCTVSGSDMKESQITEKLKEQGARIYIGHAAENVEGADIVIYSNAVSPENPELAEAARRGIPAVLRAEGSEPSCRTTRCLSPYPERTERRRPRR